MPTIPVAALHEPRKSSATSFCPLLVSETLLEEARCRRNGILISTFMLASDYGLVKFVQK